MTVACDGGIVLAAPMTELGERQPRLGMVRPHGHDVFKKPCRFVCPSGLEGEQAEQIERRRVGGVGGEHLAVQLLGLVGETGAMALKRCGEHIRWVGRGIDAGHAALAGIFCQSRALRRLAAAHPVG